MGEAASVTPPAPVLTPLPGDAGCLKGSGGFSWIPCTGTVRGQYDVSSLAVAPDGRFVYGVSLYSGYRTTADGRVQDVPGGTVVAFSRDASSGALTQLDGAAGCVKDRDAPNDNAVTVPCAASAAGLSGAKTIVLSADGRFAYVAALNDSAIVAFRRDERTGGLHQLSGAGACIEDIQDARDQTPECPVRASGLHGVRWITLSPDGRHLYAASPANDAISAFAVNRRSGALTQLPGRAACVEDALARLRGRCPATGVGLNYPRSLTVSPDGRNVYVASDSADASWPGDAGNGDAVSVFRRDPASGALTQLPGADACISEVRGRPRTGCEVRGRGLLGAFAVVVSPDGRNIYVGSDASRQGAIATFTRDPDTGALAQPSGDAGCVGSAALGCRPVTGIKGADALTITGDGRHLYVAGFFGMTVALLERDPGTGRIAPPAGGGSCVKDPRSPEPCRTTARALHGPRGITLSPDGRHAYVPSSSSGTITSFTVMGGARPAAARSRTMPSVVGLTARAARRRLRRLDLTSTTRVIRVRRARRRARPGLVYAQRPRAGARVPSTGVRRATLRVSARR